MFALLGYLSDINKTYYLEWGTKYIETSTEQTVIFPLTFKHVPSVTTGIYDADGGTYNAVTIKAIAKGTFKFSHSQGAYKPTIHYIALG